LLLLLLLLPLLDEDELELLVELDEEPVHVVHGGPLDVLVEHELVLDECETVVAQGIYSTIVVVAQDGGGHVVSQSQTVTASAGAQEHG
jgi:hypothetical protein